ncbi:hypothetical protein [Amaricoccus solimangrovi]|uniref:Flagellar protein FlgN n=1 Tax=Amaricoccus solimangrovi TaxID=2589815 RepID=A0A501WYC0_9RHOB|nr:hypothetical protein [Amaricoccus solimangrovi]TPE53580.1 hypothetical protein FJM51_00575 [Amaricoccus solimangrovi]
MIRALLDGSLLGGGSRQDRVLALLDEERRVILEGPLSRLAPLVARREAEIADILAGARPDEDFLAALRAKAARNGRLLRASLAGARAAAETATRARRAAERLRIYSADGRPVEFGSEGGTRDRRA